MKLLIVFGTTDGMTERIAERMGKVARARGVVTDVLNADRLPHGFTAEPYDAIIVGASLHAGGFQTGITRFVKTNLAALSNRPNAFFSVCLAIKSAHEHDRSEARRIAQEFPEKLGWKPENLEVIAGALMFSKYGLLRRIAMMHIAKKEMGFVDASTDTVFTDWDQVERFTEKMIAPLVRDAGAAAAM